VRQGSRRSATRTDGCSPSLLFLLAVDRIGRWLLMILSPRRTLHTAHYTLHTDCTSCADPRCAHYARRDAAFLYASQQLELSLETAMQPMTACLEKGCMAL
jgi:hypothetical protein